MFGGDLENSGFLQYSKNNTFISKKVDILN